MSTATTVRVVENALTRKSDFSIEQFKKLWEEQRTFKEMAEYFKVAPSTIYNTARLLDLKSKAELAEETAMEWTPEDPTLEEIMERAAEIRAGWPEEERVRRMSRIVLRVELRNYVYNTRTASFSST